MNTTTSKETCPQCQSSAKTNKAGVNPSGSPRWYCRPCRRTFTPVPNSIGHPPETVRLVLSSLSEGVGQRATARRAGVSHTTVAHWRKADQAQLPAEVNDLTPTEVIELDELYTFAKKKRTTTM